MIGHYVGMGSTVCLTLGVGAAPSLALLRVWVRGLLPDVAVRVRCDVVQVVDELASRAYRSGDPQVTRLKRVAEGTHMWIEVDQGPLVRGDGFRAHETEIYGRRLLAAMTESWGVVERETGTTAWAVVSLAA